MTIRMLILGLLCTGSAVMASSNVPTGFDLPEQEPVIVVEEASSWEDSFFPKLFKAIGIVAAVVVGVVVVSVVAIGITVAVLVQVAPALLIVGPAAFAWAVLASGASNGRYR